MTDPVTWSALGFLAGTVVATVAWTWWFWELIDRRMTTKLDEHEKRFHESR
jgi:hypothetical protein